MSSLQVRVRKISEIKEHPNADALDIAIVDGWQCIVKKGEYQAGDSVVYFPPDTVLPDEWIEQFGIGAYTHKGRIRQARLRGEPSFGYLAKLEEPHWVVGQDVADYYEATKYEPPVKVAAGDAAPEHALFPKYTDIENLRNFPDELITGEALCVSEKIHGTNVRVGIVGGQRMAGSRRLRRKEPSSWEENYYWFPHTLPGVRAFLESYASLGYDVVLYGEVYGRGVQNLAYGQKGIQFAAFDAMTDGYFISPYKFAELMELYGIPMVPVIDTVIVDDGYLDRIRDLANGGSKVPGANHIREGVVVQPYIPRTSPRIGGRVILKFISDSYLMKNYEEYTDE